VFYKGDPPDYVVCDGTGEDVLCSDQYAHPTSTTDHMTYMGGDCCCLSEPPREVHVDTLPPPPVNNQSKSMCDGITDCHTCINKVSVFVSVCTWCPYENLCHDVGSIYNPCPNDLCVTKSTISTCKRSTCTDPVTCGAP
jgi:hypothetical protein